MSNLAMGKIHSCVILFFLSHLVVCFAEARFCRDIVSHIEMNKRGYSVQSVGDLALDKSVAETLIARFSKANSKHLRLIVDRFVTNEIERLENTVIEKDILSFLEKSEELMSFFAPVRQMVEAAQRISPDGFLVVPSSMVIFIHEVGKRNDATGEFHQDGASLIGFLTLYSDQPKLTTRFVETVNLVPFSEIQSDPDIAGYIPIEPSGRWAKAQDVQFAPKDKAFFFYGKIGEKYYQAPALWHAGPVGLFVPHHGNRIAIGLSFELIPRGVQ